MLNKEIFIKETDTIINALKKLDKTAKKILLVVDDREKLLGTISDGDIRRYIMKHGTFAATLMGVYHKNFISINRHEYDADIVKKRMLLHKIELIPILDDQGIIVDFITWDQAFSGSKPKLAAVNHIEAPVVIMAGGEGTRLKPFTQVLPKSLIPLGEMTIIEKIINNFRLQGVKKIYVTLHYKAVLVETFLNNLPKDYEIHFIHETKFLGTAGSLKVLESIRENDFLVTNCDVLVNADYQKVLDWHKENEAFLTILGSIQHHKIPYGVINFTKGGHVVDIVEKPEQTIPINTGVYILNKKSLPFIPADQAFDMTDLITTLIKNQKKVITHLINENDYIDVGQWDLYKEAVRKLDL